jgi:hypothetical protein
VSRPLRDLPHVAAGCDQDRDEAVPQPMERDVAQTRKLHCRPQDLTPARVFDQRTGATTCGRWRIPATNRAPSAALSASADGSSCSLRATSSRSLPCSINDRREAVGGVRSPCCRAPGICRVGAGRTPS